MKLPAWCTARRSPGTSVCVAITRKASLGSELRTRNETMPPLSGLGAGAAGRAAEGALRRLPARLHHLVPARGDELHPGHPEAGGLTLGVDEHAAKRRTLPILQLEQAFVHQLLHPIAPSGDIYETRAGHACQLKHILERSCMGTPRILRWPKGWTVSCPTGRM